MVYFINNSVKGGMLTFLKKILEHNDIYGVICQKYSNNLEVPFYALISNKKEIDNDIAFPTYAMPQNVANILSSMSGFENKKIAVILRPCELRACVELIKLNQIEKENFIFLGIDCMGTVHINTYSDDEKKREKDESMEWTDDEMREECKMCRNIVPLWADIKIRYIGLDRLYLEHDTAAGHDILSALSLNISNIPEKWNNEIMRISKIKDDYRSKKYKDIKEKMRMNMGIFKYFGKCVRCYNCRDSCPICYCEDCLLESDHLALSGFQMLRRAEKKGIIKVPTDTYLFHITRMAHMMTSCVQCGMCSQACPSNIEVGVLFSCISEEVQQIFEYLSGRDVDEKIPLTDFKEDELQNMGY